MAWYQRNYFNFNGFNFKKYILPVLFSILIVISLEYSFLFNCFSIKGVGNLKIVNHGNISFRTCNQISELNAKNAFDIALNYFIQNQNYKFNICKYLYVENNMLYDFSKRSCYYHPNIFLGNFNELSINLQLSHNFDNNNFNFISNPDVFGLFKDQKICNQIYIYDGCYQKLFYNYKNISANEILKSFDNYNNFKMDNGKSLKTEKFLFDNKNNIINNFNSGFNIKK